MKINLAVVRPEGLGPNILLRAKEQLINAKRKVEFVSLGKLRALEEVTRNDPQT